MLALRPGAMDACPGAMEARPRAFEARPGVMKARPEAMEARPGAMDAQPGAFEDRPGVMEAHPGAIEDRHGALEAHHGAVEACPGAMESLSRAVEAHKESILAQMGAFGTIGSHPDEDYSMRALQSGPTWLQCGTILLLGGPPWLQGCLAHARICLCDLEDQIVPQRLLLQQWQLPWC